MPASSPGFFINRHFTFYWFVRIFTMAAFQMLAVAVGWQIYDMTESALDLGLVGLIGFAPAILFVLVAGHVADRYNRRSIVQLCNVAQCLIAAALGVASWQGWISREGIFLAALPAGHHQDLRLSNTGCHAAGSPTAHREAETAKAHRG